MPNATWSSGEVFSHLPWIIMLLKEHYDPEKELTKQLSLFQHIGFLLCVLNNLFGASSHQDGHNKYFEVPTLK